MKTWVPLLMLGFGVALAIVIGQRMSTDAMAVVIGVAVGVAASVPTSVLLVALLRRDRGGHAPPPQTWAPPLPPGQQPNVFMLDLSQLPQARPANQAGLGGGGRYELFDDEWHDDRRDPWRQ